MRSRQAPVAPMQAAPVAAQAAAAPMHAALPAQPVVQAQQAPLAAIPTAAPPTQLAAAKQDANVLKPAGAPLDAEGNCLKTCCGCDENEITGIFVNVLQDMLKAKKEETVTEKAKDVIKDAVDPKDPPQVKPKDDGTTDVTTSDGTTTLDKTTTDKIKKVADDDDKTP